MRLLLLRPSRGTVSVAHEAWISALDRGARDRGMGFVRVNNTIPGLLHHSRASLLAELAQHSDDDTRGLWTDADVWTDTGPIFRAMRRPEGVIVWNYPVRISWDVVNPPENHIRSGLASHMREQPFRLWTGSPRTGEDGYVARSADGAFVELWHCGFGAVLMKPSVARAMHLGCGPLQRDPDGRDVSNAFEHDHASPVRNSEDVSFWRRYVAAGGRIWCDPTPYVTNGQSGGRFADEIRLREATMPWLFAQGPCFSG